MGIPVGIGLMGEDSSMAGDFHGPASGVMLRRQAIGRAGWKDVAQPLISTPNAPQTHQEIYVGVQEAFKSTPRRDISAVGLYYEISGVVTSDFESDLHIRPAVYDLRIVGRKQHAYLYGPRRQQFSVIHKPILAYCVNRRGSRYRPTAGETTAILIGARTRHRQRIN